MIPAFAVMPRNTTHNTRMYLLGRGWTSVSLVSSLFVRLIIVITIIINQFIRSLTHSLTHSLAHSFLPQPRKLVMDLNTSRCLCAFYLVTREYIAADTDTDTTDDAVTRARRRNLDG